MEFVGHKITDIRPMTEVEKAAEGWDEYGLAVVLDNGAKFYASQDDEGNGPGAMFGVDSKGKMIHLAVPVSKGASV